MIDLYRKKEYRNAAIIYGLMAAVGAGVSALEVSGGGNIWGGYELGAATCGFLSGAFTVAAYNKLEKYKEL